MSQTAHQLDQKTNKKMSFLRRLRLSHGLQVFVVAKAVGVTQSHLSLLENRRRKPSIDVAKRLAKFYETTVDELFS
jgi:transcriptional regulator with XRE-family HTH domain